MKQLVYFLNVTVTEYIITISFQYMYMYSLNFNKIQQTTLEFKIAKLIIERFRI